MNIKPSRHRFGFSLAWIGNNDLSIMQMLYAHRLCLKMDVVPYYGTQFAPLAPNALLVCSVVQEWDLEAQGIMPLGRPFPGEFK